MSLPSIIYTYKPYRYDILSLINFYQTRLVTTTFHEDVIPWERLPNYWPSVRVIHWRIPSCSRGNYCRSLIYHLLLSWTRCWTNHQDAGDLRRSWYITLYGFWLILDSSVEEWAFRLLAIRILRSVEKHNLSPCQNETTNMYVCTCVGIISGIYWEPISCPLSFYRTEPGYVWFD